MHIYPADERQIAEVEQGRCCEAVVPLPPNGTLATGDAVLFALSMSPAGQPPGYVKGGDSIVVSLTDITDLGETDPVTGRALVQLSWKPLGHEEPPDPTLARARKARRARGGA